MSIGKHRLDLTSLNLQATLGEHRRWSQHGRKLGPLFRVK